MKKIICFIVSISLCISLISPAYAAADTLKGSGSQSIVFDNQVQPKTNGYYSWELTSKGNNTETYGSWSELCRKYTNGTSNGTISGSLSASVSHTVTGNLQVSISKLTSYLGLQHTIGKAWTRTVSDSESLKGLSKGTYAIKWRPVYNSQPVTQTKYYHIDGSKVKAGTAVVTVKKFKSVSFKLEKISNSNIS